MRVGGYFLQRMKTKWGSANPHTRHIRLNTELVKKPKDLLEYVSVHEMIHLVEQKHNERFVALLDEHYPTWREAKSGAERTTVGCGAVGRRGAFYDVQFVSVMFTHDRPAHLHPFDGKDFAEFERLAPQVSLASVRFRASTSGRRLVFQDTAKQTLRDTSAARGRRFREPLDDLDLQEYAALPSWGCQSLGMW